MTQKKLAAEEQIKILKFDVMKELCFLEATLIKKVGKENAAFFVDPLKKKVDSMIKNLKGEINNGSN